MQITTIPNLNATNLNIHQTGTTSADFREKSSQIGAETLVYSSRNPLAAAWDLGLKVFKYLLFEDPCETVTPAGKVFDQIFRRKPLALPEEPKTKTRQVEGSFGHIGQAMAEAYSHSMEDYHDNSDDFLDGKFCQTHQYSNNGPNIFDPDQLERSVICTTRIISKNHYFADEKSVDFNRDMDCECFTTLCLKEAIFQNMTQISHDKPGNQTSLIRFFEADDKLVEITYVKLKGAFGERFFEDLYHTTANDTRANRCLQIKRERDGLSLAFGYVAIGGLGILSVVFTLALCQDRQKKEKELEVVV